MTIGHKLIGRGDVGVIVLHGWLGDHTVYAPIFPFLDVERFTYAFADSRGYGLSRDMTGDYTAAEMAADVVALARKLGWSRYHLVGHSMTGMVVQQTIADAKGSVRSACLLTPVPACGLQLPAEGKAMFRAASGNAQTKRGIIDFSTGNRLSAAWLDWMTRQCEAAVTEPAFSRYFEMFDLTDISAGLKGNETPMLVLAGEHDPAITPDLMRNTFSAWFPNAKLEVVSNSGHYPMQETPVYLAGRMEKFFASQQ